MLLGRGKCKCGEPLAEEFPGATMGWFRWLIHALFYLGAFYYLTVVVPFHIGQKYLYVSVQSVFGEAYVWTWENMDIGMAGVSLIVVTMVLLKISTPLQVS